MMPNPTSQKTGVPIQKSIRFFHNDIACVFFALVNPVFDHCESSLHEEDQCCADEDPSCVLLKKYIVNTPFPNFFFFPIIMYRKEFFVIPDRKKIDRILSSISITKKAQERGKFSFRAFTKSKIGICKNRGYLYRVING